LKRLVQEDTLVQMKRPELSPGEGNEPKKSAVSKPDLRAGGKDKDDRLSGSQISVEEHLAGLWKVLGLGD
jgi:hypothetical protein